MRRNDARGVRAAPNQHSSVPLSDIYDELAQRPDYERNPVIVVPGILGSQLTDRSTNEIVWGELYEFGDNHLEQLALPMHAGVPLHRLHDPVVPSGPLDQLTFKVLGLPIHVNAYAQILATLGVGGYRDKHFRGRMGLNEVDYGDEHFTCYQFAYDWRRDVSESAAQLHQFIEQSAATIQEEYASRYGITNQPVRFDIVAHSMGGLVARYYLRYGNQVLPEDGSLPVLNWAGARRINQLILVGTPNRGSTQALVELQEGMQLAKGLPHFPAAVVGTMPAAYQLLPRPQDAQVLLDGHPVNFLDPRHWIANGWGLADPKRQRELQRLLPQSGPHERQQIAQEHLAKCLSMARQFHASLDVVAPLPPGTEIHLFAGDAKKTLSELRYDSNGFHPLEIKTAGDGTVTRASAASEYKSATGRRQRGIKFDSETFIESGHVGLTRDRIFVDNVLNRLLKPK